MFWMLALIFGAFLLIDILGHICLRVKRSFVEWLLFAVMVVMTCGSVVKGTIGLFDTPQSTKPQLYMAYKYLVDGNVVQARNKLAQVNGEMENKGEILELMAELVDQNYVQGYFAASKLLEDGKLSSDDGETVQKVMDLCQNKLGISGETENIPEDYNEYVTNLSAQNDEYVQNLDTASEEVTEIIDEYMEKIKISDDDEKQFIEDYELDKKLNGTEISEISEEDISNIEDKYGATEEVMRLRCKYYVNIKDYDRAKKAAAELVDKYRNEENYIIYTDIIAQEAYENESILINGDNETEISDSEIKNLLKKAADKEEEANALIEKYGDSDDENVNAEIDSLLSQAQDIRKEAAYIPVERAINYIISKKPMGGDDTGLYDLQLAKLYLVTGDRDKASKYLYDVIDNNVDVNESSSIKNSLDEVVSQYNQISDDEYNAELNAAIDEMVKEQSSGVVPSNEGTINGTFGSYVSSTLKYDKINIHISRIDKTNYPSIKAYVNINGTKDGSSDLASDFSEKDFSLIDTLYQIDNFKLVRDEASQNVSMAIVMDKSGSMDGAAINNAKSAALEAVKHLNGDTQKLALVTYSDGASLVQGLTNKKEVLQQKINDIYAAGGTNISSGLVSALSELKSEEGTRAIILMSDGLDNGSAEDMEAAVNEAVDNNIAVYTVAFGECDDVYMKSIADATGGKFLKAADSAELADIYLTLQRYIVNNYCFEYTVEKNVSTDPRYLTVSISEYNTSETKDYYINEANKPDGEDSGESIEKIDENTLGISFITPGSVGIKDVADGIEVTVTGGGFEEGMAASVGNIPLTDISIESKTQFTGRIKGEMEPGCYDVQVKTGDGKLAIGSGKFVVYKSGVTQSIRFGSNTITADSIGQVSDTTLIASGNVMINGFIHSSGNMKIIVNDMNPDIDLISEASVYVGESGTIEGSGKLYISYAQMTDNGSGAFADLVMNGQDYVIQKKQYRIEVDANTTSLDRTVENYNLSIPFIMDIDVAEVNLYANRLQVDIKSFDIDKIVDDMDDSMSHKTGTNKPDPKVLKRSEANKFNISNAIDGGLSMAMTADGMQFGGEVKLDVNDAISFGTFGIKSFGVKLNSLDKDKEYWKISGEIDFSKLIPGFGGTGIEGLEGSLSSYYWLPDHIKLDAYLNPGIPVYKIIEINKVGGEMQGFSTLILGAYEKLVSPETYNILGTNIKSDAYDSQDVILKANVGAEADLFSSFDGNNKLFKKFKQWGELGTIDGSAEINFSEPEFKIAAEAKLLDSEKVGVDASISKKGVNIAGNAELGLSGFGIEVKGKTDVGVNVNLTGAEIPLSVNGNVDCAALNIHSKGEASVKLEWEWDFDYAAVTVGYKDGSKQVSKSLWYKEDGSLFFFDKFHTSSN